MWCALIHVYFLAEIILTLRGTVGPQARRERERAIAAAATKSGQKDKDE